MVRRRSTTRALAALLLALAMVAHTAPVASAARRAPATGDCALAAAPSGSHALAVTAPRHPTPGAPVSRRSPSLTHLPRLTTIAEARADTPPHPPFVPRARSRTIQRRAVAADDPLPH